MRKREKRGKGVCVNNRPPSVAGSVHREALAQADDNGIGSCAGATGAWTSSSGPILHAIFTFRLFCGEWGPVAEHLEQLGIHRPLSNIPLGG